MHKHSISGFICWLLGFLVTHTYAQTEVDPVTAVTLWQFGKLRLLAGQWGTLPLIPLGTAAGGVETTYLYQAVNPVVVTTTNEDGFLLEGPSASATPRTVIASASGWFEAFTFANAAPTQPGHTIACNLVNSGFGVCVDIVGASTATSNSGLPTSAVFLVSLTGLTPVTPTSSIALTVPPTPVVLTGPPTPTSSAFNSASAPTSKPSSVRTGPIVGGIVGGFGALVTIVALFVLCRRRQRKLLMLEDGIAPRAFTENFAPQPLAAPFPAKGTVGPTHHTPHTKALSSLALTDPYRPRYTSSDALAAGENHNQVHVDLLPPSYLDSTNRS
ncbi:hypothetical protein GGX14DRAFT_560872 [Mycena pura]|uniref:Mid2 domain-containing protein n=1 Tax=Mycena pura TaxID=153505 RepID=A0AAD6VP19_9AGAR|nr:hypothetical protein GGX14DRAFT_560872 [Mycena pura]